MNRLAVSFARNQFGGVLVRHMSKDRAVKLVRPGVTILIDGNPHKIQKIVQGMIEISSLMSFWLV